MRRPPFQRAFSRRSSTLYYWPASTSPVVYFTMQIVGVTVAELTILPKVPLLAFLFVQNLTYFVLFTAGGQTMGQMALGSR
jgi:hypothetical protein